MNGMRKGLASCATIGRSCRSIIGYHWLLNHAPKAGGLTYRSASDTRISSLFQVPVYAVPFSPVQHPLARLSNRP